MDDKTPQTEPKYEGADSSLDAQLSSSISEHNTDQTSSPIPESSVETSRPPAITESSPTPSIDIWFRWFVFGMVLLFLTAHWESKHLSKVPWSDGIVIWNKDDVKQLITAYPELLDSQRILVIPQAKLSSETIENRVVEWINRIELGTEPVVETMHFPVFVWLDSIKEFLPILATGRLPEPGAFEALAGDLTPNQTFHIGNTPFTVVGTIKKECAPFLGSYVIPYESFMQMKSETDFNLGVFFRNRKELLLRLKSTDKDTNDILTSNKEWAGLTSRTPTLFAWTTLLGIFIICISMRNIMNRMYIRLAQPPTPILGPLFLEILNRQKGFRAVNNLFYTLFFVCMTLALFNPEAHRVIVYYINQVFSEGSLEYIGKAYLEGEIFKAGLATFHNNFWVQTFILTILISIPPFMLGAFKNLISFAFAGFAMAPIWSGSAIRMTFHTITMVLELEAYILAVFAVIMWTYYFWTAFISRGELLKRITHGLRILMAVTVASGCILAIAGWYEALTIILFSNL